MLWPSMEACELECECEDCCPDLHTDDAEDARRFEDWKAQNDYERAMEMDEFLAGLVEHEEVDTDAF